MPSQKVTITVTNKTVGSYEARSYPHDDYNGNGKIELYKVPVYEIIISGIDAGGKTVNIKHKAPRFMPYWNNPAAASTHYRTKGWVNSGLSHGRTIVVSKYLRNYEVQNRYSPGRGAIVLKDSFYIHGGPANETDIGFGSAGCIEIIGDYDKFKRDISSLSGLSSASADDAITTLVRDKHLVVKVQPAAVPNIRNLFTREI